MCCLLYSSLERRRINQSLSLRKFVKYARLFYSRLNTHSGEGEHIDIILLPPHQASRCPCQVGQRPGRTRQMARNCCRSLELQRSVTTGKTGPTVRNRFRETVSDTVKHRPSFKQERGANRTGLSENCKMQNEKIKAGKKLLVYQFYGAE